MAEHDEQPEAPDSSREMPVSPSAAPAAPATPATSTTAAPSVAAPAVATNPNATPTPTPAFTRSVVDSKVTAEILREVESHKRLMEPQGILKAVQQELERQSAHERRLASDIARYQPPGSDALKFFQTPSVVLQALETELKSFLATVRASELASINWQRDVAHFKSVSVVDFKLPDALRLADTMRWASEGSVSGWIRDEEIRQKAISAALRPSNLWAEEIAKSCAAIEIPWVRIAKEQESWKAMFEVASIGLALKNVHPYDEGLTASLRGDLGDWRQAPELKVEVWAQPDERRRIYLERGFNEALTDFPDEALAEGLSTAELCDNYLAAVDVEAFVLGSVDADTEAALGRSAACFRLLNRLEHDLRTFIDTLMTLKYGANWVNARVALCVRDEWEKRQASALARGRPFARLIDAADFTEYEAIICRKDSFADVFQPYFRVRESVKESFARLGPHRLDTMHARPMSKDDVFYVAVETKRLLTAMSLKP